MYPNLLTDYKEAIDFAKENPGHTVRFEGNLPSGYSATQNITVLNNHQRIDEVIENTPGRIVVGHGGGNGYMVVGTEMFDGQACVRQWPASGDKLRCGL